MSRKAAARRRRHTRRTEEQRQTAAIRQEANESLARALYDVAPVTFSTYDPADADPERSALYWR